MTDDQNSRADLERQVQRLRQTRGWDPQKFVKESPLEALQRLDQEAQDEQVYEQAQGCAECTQVRLDTGDETALCDEHLQQALMGDF